MKFKFLVTVALAGLIGNGCSIKSSNSNINIGEENGKKSIGKIKTYGYNDLEEMITCLADQLFNNSKVLKNSNVAITSLVDLDNLSKTSKIGRYISESLINELHIRKFSIVEYRTLKNAIQLNEQGEYFISRDTKKLYQTTNAKYVLVGTYHRLGDSILSFNLRMIDVNTNKVVSTARAYYTFNTQRFVNLNNYKLSF